MTFIIIICHLIVDGLCGLAFLQSAGERDFGLFALAKAVAIGMFIDTMFLAILNYVGISILTSFIIFSILSITFFLYNWKFKLRKLNWTEPLFKERLSIGELLLLVFIGEKMIWSLVNLIRLPIYFDDALNHWSGRGKAMLTQVNWSWDPESVYFLGKAFGHMEYPLFASVWRATNTAFLGSANGISERADGLVMWLIIMIATTAWIYQQTERRWLGLAGAFVISAMPLEAWHITAGYAEIFIQAYLLLSLWSIMNNRFILAGIFCAAMVWSKNEGLILFIPCVLGCLIFKLILDHQTTIKSKFRTIILFNVSWMIAIAPWLLFKVINGVGFTIPGNRGISYVEGALGSMSKSLFNTPSSSILWLFLLGALIINSYRIIKNKYHLTLAIGAITLLLMMVFIFTSTGAYIFLENQMTIHRSLLQIAPVFIIVVMMSIGSRTDPPVKELLEVK